MEKKQKKPRSSGRKGYLISLYQTRSVIAMCAGILILILTFMAIVKGLLNWGEDGEMIFRYFTVLSNMFSAVGAAFMIPYAVEGIRHKRFVLPHWVTLFQYCGALGVTITLTCTLFIILPVQGRSAVTGMNFWLHLITPPLTVILFECVETGNFFSRAEMLVALIPYWGYMAVYFIMVVVIGEENGGWKDIYYTQAFWPAWISAIMMFLVGYIEAVVLRLIHNRRARESRVRVSKTWSETLEPIELKIEAFGLGRFMGENCDPTGVSLPLDIFAQMSERYGVPVYDLSKAYVKGAIDSASKQLDTGARGEKHP